MTEPELRAAVIELAERNAVRWVHLREARREPGPWVRGLPDLFLIGEHACMWRELKAGTGEHGGQKAWRYALSLAGQDAAVWRPRGLADGTIRAELEAINQPWPGQEPDTTEQTWRRDYARSYFHAVRSNSVNR